MRYRLNLTRLRPYVSRGYWSVALLDEVVLRKRPIQIAGGFFLGMAMGLNAWMTLQGACLAVAFLLIRLNWLAVAGGLTLGTSFYYAATPWFHSVGEFVLTRTPNYFRLWAGLYHAPILPFTRFHNTVCMGGIVFTFLVAIPATLAVHFLFQRHGQALIAWVRSTQGGEKLAESKAWRQYAKYRSRIR